MLRYMHKIVRRDPLTINLTGAIGGAADRFDGRMDDYRDQIDVDKATWALSIYEKDLGLPIDVKKPLDERRSIIKGRWRSTGKVGAAEIKLVAESWANGEVDVQFDGEIHITFISTRGVPANIDDIKDAINEIVPAHLAITYKFTYLQWSELDAENWTWDAFDAMGFTWDTLEVYRPQ